MFLEIVTMAAKLKNKFCYGDDEIPMLIVKFTVYSTCNILSYITNNFLKFGIFLDQLKLAAIKTLSKKRDDKNLYLFIFYRVLVKPSIVLASHNVHT